ncbi:MAG: hypothetical protein DAHOPDDO_02915 [Ignavibacteriaceae bacterium]|nr:hypothetical protein [Ignavibacteriaceae bacterium]
MYNEEFSFTEYSINGKRHKFHKISDKNVYRLNDKNVFKSIFLHSKELKIWFNEHVDDEGNHTLAGYDKAIHADCLALDIDHKDLNVSLETIRNFLQHLYHKYEIEPNHLRLNFSGSKGFHIRIPAELFGGFTPSTHLHKQIKFIAEEITKGFDHYDYSIYKRTFFIRVLNTLNSKSGLRAIPLSYNEVMNLSIENIKTLAVQERTVDYVDVDELSANDQLVALRIESEKIKVTDDDTEEDEDDNTNYDEIWANRSAGGRHEQVGKIIGHLINYDVPDKSIENIVRYWNLQNNEPKTDPEIKKYIKGFLGSYRKEEKEYWRITRSTRGKGKVKIKMYSYMKFLEKQGFAKKYLDSSYVFVKSENNVVEQYELSEIKDFIIEHIKDFYKENNYYEEALLNELLDRNGRYFSKGLIECIPSIDLYVIRDKKDEANFYFKNGFVKVEKNNGVTLHNYSELDGRIWKSQIIQRDFSPLDVKQKSVYEQFLFNVAGKSDDRLKTIKSSIGYLLHGYKDSANAKVVVLVDEKIPDDGEPNGRTGKSIYGKALSKLKKSSRIDGKNFTFTERFTFQEVYLDTKILEFNDVTRKFDFERLFSVTTDDMTIENKKEKPFTLKFEDSPKLLVSTNYTIKGQGASYEDRLFEVEFSDHYNENHKPLDDFGKRLFDDWDSDEWNRFDNFMLECVELYLKEGLVEYQQINLDKRKLLDKTSPEFVEFAEQSIEVGSEYEKTALYNDFKFQFTDFTWLKQRTFTNWTKLYADYLKFDYMDRKSSGNNYFWLEDPKGGKVANKTKSLFD